MGIIRFETCCRFRVVQREITTSRSSDTPSYRAANLAWNEAYARPNSLVQNRPTVPAVPAQPAPPALPDRPVPPDLLSAFGT